MLHTNRLIQETSPYLLQHAHNPVDWYPWGEEALQKAQQENKPILVSIGYAACHWCHVMERESFENEGIAAIMNEYFVNIKIDREERPDLDHIYMDAVQAMTGSGGWPLNIFLTPEKKPFFGGTYFPPVKAYNRASWSDVLEGIHKNFVEKRAEIEAQAAQLTAHLLSSNKFGFPSSKTLDLAQGNILETMTENLLQQADSVWGGFGKAPKFPQTFSIQFLLRQYHFTHNEVALKQALLSLDKMIYGGIYDQLGGGFARYSTDAQWMAPHFEKMLYDNALLISVIAEAYQITHLPIYAKAIEESIAFIEREMLDQEGGFYSALDADSEGVEGKFYTWDFEEIEKILGEDANVFNEYYQVVEKGNWEHTNILWVKDGLDAFAEKKGMLSQDLAVIVTRSKQLLLAERSKRIRPGLDDKILLGWNALMNTAYSKAYAALGKECYRDSAIANMAFLEKAFYHENGTWHHTYKKQIAKLPAFLDDYAYLIQAYIQLQEITGNGNYLLKAKSITELVCSQFSEQETGFFYFTNEQQTDILLRKKEVYDGAIPSGNAVMASNLGYLSVVFDLPIWKERAMGMLVALASAIIKYPTSFAVWASLMQQQKAGVLEVAVTGKLGSSQVAELMKPFIPNKIIQYGETNSGIFPLLKNRETKETIAIYVCKDYSCRAPFFKIADFLANV